MRISHKREFLARRLRDLGALGLIERLSRRPGLSVLCYHRVGDPASDPFYGPIVSATPENFRAQVQHVRDHFRVVTLEALQERIDDDGRLRISEPTALITFDDGYRDNVDQALPILRELGVPAGFFLTTGFVDQSRLPWWDHVAWVVKGSPRSGLTLERPEPLDVPWAGPDRAGAIARVIAAFLRADRPDDPELLAHLEARAEVAVDVAETARALLMTWDDARRLVEAGMSIGSHTVTHPKLSGLTRAEQSSELVESKRRIERELGLEVSTVAYPYGVADAFDDATLWQTREAGYRLAFTLLPGIQRPDRTDPLQIHRFGVGPADTPVLLRARLALAGAFGRSPL